MIRQQLRRETREVIKLIEKAKKTKEFKAMTKYFETLSKEDYIILDKIEHPDPNKQKEFDGFMRSMATFVELETRRDYLQALQKAKSTADSGRRANSSSSMENLVADNGV